MKTHSTRRLYTIDDYHRMVDDGLLQPDDRVELIEGVIIPMSPILSPHAGCVNRTSALLHRRLAGRAVVATQNPIVLNRYTEPEPDVSLLRSRADFYGERHPEPDDVLLLVEVAASSLLYDRRTKIPLYARAGIPEVWLVDLRAQKVEVHRRPSFRVYREVKVLGRGRRLAPAAFPRTFLRVNEILG